MKNNNLAFYMHIRLDADLNKKIESLLNAENKERGAKVSKASFTRNLLEIGIQKKSNKVNCYICKREITERNYGRSFIDGKTVCERCVENGE